MTDDQTHRPQLGRAPAPSDEARSTSIDAAMARYDELVVDGHLTAGDSMRGPSMGSAAPTDELDARRQRRTPWANPQRLLAAAAMVVVLGAGGALAAQALGQDGDASSSTDQAEALSGNDTTADDSGAAGDAPEIADSPAVDADASLDEAASGEEADTQAESATKASVPEATPGDVADPGQASAESTAARTPAQAPETDPSADDAEVGFNAEPTGLRGWVCRLLGAYGFAICGAR